MESTKRAIAIARNNKNSGSRIMRTSYCRKPPYAVATRKANTCKKRTLDLQLQPNEPKKMKTTKKRPSNQPDDKHLNPREVRSAVATRSNERKLNNEWIQVASNSIIDVNVNELFQDANLFNLSDIEDDAFQLEKYLESSDQPIHTFTVSSANPTSLNIRQTDRGEKSLERSEIRWDETIVSEINFDRISDSSNKQSTPIKCFGNDICTLNVSSPLSHGGNVTNSDLNFNEYGKMYYEEKIIIDEFGQNNQFLVNENDQRLQEFSEMLSTDTSQKALSEYNCTNDNTKLELESNKTSDGMELEILNNNIVSTSPGVTQALSNTELQITANNRLGSTSLTKPAAAGNFVSSDLVKYAGAYTRITRNNALKQQMTNLFNRPCYNYLNGKHCGKYMCKWNHYLPAAYDVYQKMMRLSNDTIMYMYYNFIVKTKKVFATYFPTICDTFGSKKKEKSLLNAIKDCEQRDEILFIKHIFNGLVMTGLSKHEALTSVADCCTKGRAINDLILEIIIETDPLYFLDMLKLYYPYATITSHHLTKLLYQVIDTPAPLLNVFIDILDQYSMYHVCDVETFKSLVSTAKSLVDGDINLSQRLNNLVSRVP